MLAKIDISFPEIEAQLKRIADACEILAGTNGNNVEITVPSFINYKLKGQDMLKNVYDIFWAPVVAGEGVTKRELTTVIDSGPTNTEALGPEVNEKLDFKVPVGADVVLTLVDVDQSGNRSDEAELRFTATDETPPTSPGGLGVTSKGQVDEP